MAAAASAASQVGTSSASVAGRGAPNGAGSATSGTRTGAVVVVASPGTVVDETLLLLVTVGRVVLVPGTVDVVEVPPGAVPTARPRSIRPTPYSLSRPGAPRSWAVASNRSMAAC